MAGGEQAGRRSTTGGVARNGSHLREVEQRADEAERTRDEAARRKAVEERLRIARELHDSLTHSISVIKVQAGVAVHLARKRGQEVSAALAAIQEASADAARELRATLSVLRREDDGDGGGLGQLPGLVERARAAGQPVTVTVTGAERQLPPEVGQAAYRIVQEALTNVSRHAGQARAHVHLRYEPGTLTVQVDDNGKSTITPPSASGLGLISGIRSLLEAEDDIEVVAEAADGRQAVALARQHRPDIALVDVQMPVMDGIEATRQMVAYERLAGVRVVILTNYGLDENIFRALRAGASGFLLKDTEPAELLQALRVVMRGEALLSPAVTQRLISEFTARPPDALASAGTEALTGREREVAALVAHGLSNDEIAAAMVLSPMTVKTHVSRAMTKLGARDRAQLVVFAYQTGLVSPRDPSPPRLPRPG